MSPAMFAIFWVADPDAVARKELITFVGLSLFALGAVRDKPILLWVGTIVFSVALFAHEAMVIFVPTILAIVVVSAKNRNAHFYPILFIIILSSIVSLSYNLFYVSTANSVSMCSDLLALGFHQDFCGGAIEWIDKDLNYGLYKLSNKLEPHRIAAYCVAYALSLAPFIYILRKSSLRNHVALLLFVMGLPFILLNFIALDWGRWVSLHIFSLATLMICAFSSGFAKINTAISGRTVAAFSIISLLVSPTHIIGLRVGGVLRTFVQAVI